MLEMMELVGRLDMLVRTNLNDMRRALGSNHFLLDDDFIGEISFLANPLGEFPGHVRYAPVDQHHRKGDNVLEDENKRQPSCHHVPVIVAVRVFVFGPVRFSRVPVSEQGRCGNYWRNY